MGTSWRDFWRAHQIPLLDPKTNPKHLKLVEQWMRSYKPEELFDGTGRLVEELRETGAEGNAADHGESACEWRAAAEAAGDAGFSRYAVKVEEPGQTQVSSTYVPGGVSARCDAAEHDELSRLRAG